MDPELRSVIRRYTIVGVLIAGAAIWTVYFVGDNQHKNGAPGFVGADAGPAAATESTAPEARSQAGNVAKAPALSQMITKVLGVDRVACAPACRLEAYCSLRSVDDCLKTSCDGDVRIVSNSDFDFARAEDCGAAALAPCEEACFRRGECSKDHGDDARCAQSCRTITRQRPAEMYRESRCILETKQCADLALCGAVAR